MNRNWIVALAGVAVVVGLASFTVLGTKVYEKSEYEDKQHIVEKIESSKGVVLLDSFSTEPDAVKFVESNLIEIKGAHETYGEGTYLVNLDEMTVNQLESMEIIDPETYVEILRSPYGLILGMKDDRKGLYHQTPDGALKKISGNFVLEQEADVKLSESGNKLIYLVRESGQMATYSLTTSKKKVVPGTIPDAVLKDFGTSVDLSPDGGYFMIFNSEGLYGDHKVNVYGADSGRKYADEIHGTSPAWSPDGQRLGYIYSGLLENPQSLSDTRIGYIKFPEREIVYFDKVSSEHILGDKLYWNQDGTSISYVRKSIGDGTSELRTYSIADGLLYSFEFQPQNDAFPTDVIIGNSRIVMYWEENETIKIFDTDGVVKSTEERIDTIRTFDSENVPFIVSNGSFMFYKGTELVIQGESSREVLEMQGLKQVVFAESARWIVAGLETDGEYKLSIVSRK